MYSLERPTFIYDIEHIYSVVKNNEKKPWQKETARNFGIKKYITSRIVLLTLFSFSTAIGFLPLAQRQLIPIPNHFAIEKNKDLWHKETEQNSWSKERERINYSTETAHEFRILELWKSRMKRNTKIWGRE